VEHCAGVYVMVPNRLPNGFPLWKQRDGDHFLYSGTGKRWFIGDEEEEEMNFVCNSGIIVGRDIHRGSPSSGAWQRFDGEAWVDDDAISVTLGSRCDAPHVSNGFESDGRSAGKLDREGFSRDDFGSSSVRLPEFGQLGVPSATRRVAGPVDPQSGEPMGEPRPHQRSDEEQSSDENSNKASSRELGSYIPSFSSSPRLDGPAVTSSSSVTLHIDAPEMSICSGFYRVVPDKMPNGLPLWKQEDGDHFVFSGTGGRWFVGDDEEERLGFRCNAGVIVSRNENNGRMPHEIGIGAWQLFDGDNWVDDRSIQVIAATSSKTTEEAPMSRRAPQREEAGEQRRWRGGFAGRGRGGRAV
jgi:hypothetical protein